MWDLSVKFVDLLKSEALRLIDKCPNEEHANEAAATPDEEDFGAKVGLARFRTDEIRCGTGEIVNW
jgi:hypothetical protein